jgi:hypothetical protein
MRVIILVSLKWACRGYTASANTHILTSAELKTIVLPHNEDMLYEHRLLLLDYAT